MTGLKKFKNDLRDAGRRNPQLLMQKLRKFGLSGLECDIMKLRYVDGLLIKQIPDKVNVGERWVKKVHLRALMKTLDGMNVSDLIDLGIPICATSKTLYLP